ncbi:MAG TPA: FMN reductase [Actinomycetales bacterium]|nr:FMN reductase [Actinomycetales bacterium]
MSARKIAVLTAGLSQPSSTRMLADQLAEATRRELGGRGQDVEVTVLELRDLAHDVVNNMLTGFPSDQLQEALDAVVGADAVIAVTPIFSASYSGLFKSFVDVLPQESLVGKPVLIAATAGTARHSLALEHALRPLFAYLRAVVVPTSVFAATEDFGGSEQSHLARRIDRAAEELADEVLRREPASVSDPFELTESFEQLLNR